MPPLPSQRGGRHALSRERERERERRGRQEETPNRQGEENDGPERKRNLIRRSDSVITFRNKRPFRPSLSLSFARIERNNVA